MSYLFRKNRLSGLIALLLFSTIDCPLAAQEDCYTACNRVYVGAFGGEIFSNSTQIIQRGTVFFTEAEGGPLYVDARGRSGHNSVGFGGVQLGYEWTQCPTRFGCSNWSITSAIELEAYFYSHTKKGHLINPTTRLPEHDFLASFPMHMGVYLVNGVFTLNNCGLEKFSPYLGGGIGFANISIRKADSQQESPVEPGINHFNSDRSDSDKVFAAQAKAGVRYNICGGFHIFGEYRFLYVDRSRYIFGATVYDTHAPTSVWDVDVKGFCNNAFAFGFQFDL